MGINTIEKATPIIRWTAGSSPAPTTFAGHINRDVKTKPRYMASLRACYEHDKGRKRKEAVTGDRTSPTEDTMTADEAYELLGDGVMWLDGELYFMRCGGTQDIVPVPKEVALDIMPRLCHYARFGQERWYVRNDSPSAFIARHTNA